MQGHAEKGRRENTSQTGVLQRSLLSVYLFYFLPCCFIKQQNFRILKKKEKLFIMTIRQDLNIYNKREKDSYSLKLQVNVLTSSKELSVVQSTTFKKFKC